MICIFYLQLTDCRQSKDVSEKSEVVLLARQVEDKAPYILWKGRHTETSFKGNNRELSLPPIFVSQIIQKQEHVQPPSVFVKNLEKQNEKQDENVKVEQKINEQTLDTLVDKPSVVSKGKVNLRTKLEQIKKAVQLDQKKNGETITSVKEGSITEKTEETAQHVCETTESEISDVEASHSTEKDFLQVKELQSVQQFQPMPLQLEVAKVTSSFHMFELSAGLHLSANCKYFTVIPDLAPGSKILFF